jgi:hypothetical protein
MDKLKGKKMLFKVQAVIGPHALYDGSYRVRRVCIDEAIIELFLTDDEIYSPSKVIFTPHLLVICFELLRLCFSMDLNLSFRR